LKSILYFVIIMIKTEIFEKYDKILMSSYKPLLGCKSPLQYLKMKINKYDRQIRLWGATGQKKLAEAKVALLGCSGAGI